MMKLIATFERVIADICRVGSRLTFVLMPTVLLTGCMTIDRQTPRTMSSALTDAEAKATSLGASWAAMAPQDQTLSAFHLLPNSLEAFAARVALIETAERTIDLQYYIFESDDTGLYIIDRLVAAADRGVRVRLMLDDMYCHGIEKNLAAFDAHPNIELRLFNPWTQRSNALVRGIEFLFTSRLNHRMHNKMFIVDCVVAVLGGRNIADEYFDLSHEFEFKDLDVAAIGPVASESSELFDAFWNGPDAIPVSGFKPMPDFEGLFEEWRPRLEAHRETMRDSPFAEAVRATDFVQRLKTRSVHWVMAKGRVWATGPARPRATTFSHGKARSRLRFMMSSIRRRRSCSSVRRTSCPARRPPASCVI